MFLKSKHAPTVEDSVIAADLHGSCMMPCHMVTFFFGTRFTRTLIMKLPFDRLNGSGTNSREFLYWKVLHGFRNAMCIFNIVPVLFFYSTRVVPASEFITTHADCYCRRLELQQMPNWLVLPRDGHLQQSLVRALDSRHRIAKCQGFLNLQVKSDKSNGLFSMGATLSSGF